MESIEHPAAAESLRNGEAESPPRYLQTAIVLGAHWGKLLVIPVLAAACMFGIATLLRPTFVGTTTFIPPQQQQSGGAAALASLGALSSLAGPVGAIGLHTPGDQYVSLLQSTLVSDHIIDKFGLMQIYGEKYRIKARETLHSNVVITLGKKDGMITIEASDHSPSRAAAIANAYVDELRQLTATIAVTEAQQRRQFFEHQLQATKDKLTAAQMALQASGFDPGAIKAEPRAAADTYAKLRAELTAAEVRLQTMRSTFADTSAEVVQQEGNVHALREQVDTLEASTTAHDKGDSDYVGKYREFKYQETLFDLYARQFELARADESREGALIQVVDAAQAPELKSKPRRILFAAGGFVLAWIALLGWLLGGNWLRESMRDIRFAEGMQDLRKAIALR